MERELVATGDGSHTLYVAALDEHYHSVHGAVQESDHVFITHGLLPLLTQEKTLHIFEMGLGTGLNLLLTALNCGEHPVQYTAIEAYPVDLNEAQALNYPEILEDPRADQLLERIHTTEWNVPFPLKDRLSVTKLHTTLADLANDRIAPVDLIYYDAFAPDAQPELWTEDIFKKLYDMMAPGGVLTTYCAKGVVKRTMKAAGFEVKALPGPPGKREMTHAIKPIGA